MFKTITVLRYKLKILFSNKSFLIAMTIIPILLTFITGYALKFEKHNQIPIAICDLDNTDYSRTILKRLEGKKGFKIFQTDERKVIKLVKDYKVESAFIIKEGFKNNILAGNIKGTIEQIAHPSSVSSEIIKEIMGGEVARIILNTEAANWVISEYIDLNIISINDYPDRKEQIWTEAWEHTDALWEPGPPMKLEFKEFNNNLTNPAVSREASPQTGSISSSAFGMLIAFIMFLIMFNSGWLIEERENDTLKRVIIGPDGLKALFAGNILSLLVVGITQVILFSTICKVFFKIDIFTRISNIMIILIYLLSVIAISLFISSLLKTRIQLQAGAPIFSIVTGFLGGCFWNPNEIGGIIKTISLFTPQGLALDLLNEYAHKFDSIKVPMQITTVLSSTSAIILISLSISLTSASYILIKKSGHH